jgi:hypothetical protein
LPSFDSRVVGGSSNFSGSNSSSNSGSGSGKWSGRDIMVVRGVKVQFAAANGLQKNWMEGSVHQRLLDRLVLQRKNKVNHEILKDYIC